MRSVPVVEIEIPRKFAPHCRLDKPRALRRIPSNRPAARRLHVERRIPTSTLSPATL